MEKLIVLAVILLGSAISSYFQNKKKREEEELERRSPGTSPRAGESPIPHRPKTGRDWQEDLRRILQGRSEQPPSHAQTVPPRPPQAVPSRGPIIPPARQTTPPPIVRTKIILPTTPKAPAEPSEGDLNFPSPLKQSATAYDRASQLSGRVESRMEAIDSQTDRHKPTAIAARATRSGATIVKRLTRNRESLREAFIASLVFAPPVGLRD